MWPFKRAPVLDDDTRQWQFECFEWLTAEFGEDIPIGSRKLVLPRPGFFVTDAEKGHRLARSLFDAVKSYAGVADWPVTLVADRAAPHYGHALLQPNPIRQPLGTFQIRQKGVVEISYEPGQLRDPPSLIATFAHEIAHYVLATARTDPPCDREELEFLTDITAVYLGFGVFLSNNVLNFEKNHDLGGGWSSWSYQRKGYLPEHDLVHATAMFVRLSSADPAGAEQSLKPALAKTFKRAYSDLARHEAEMQRWLRAAPSESAAPGGSEQK